MQWPILWVFRTTSPELICSTKSLGAEWDFLCSWACRFFIPAFLSLSRHTGRPNSPVSSWNKHLIAANLLDLKIQIWINVCIWMDKMAERELGGRSGNVGVNDSLFRYLLKKKKESCVLDVEHAELSTRNHLVIIFFEWTHNGYVKRADITGLKMTVVTTMFCLII